MTRCERSLTHRQRSPYSVSSGSCSGQYCTYSICPVKFPCHSLLRGTWCYFRLFPDGVLAEGRSCPTSCRLLVTVVVVQQILPSLQQTKRSPGICQFYVPMFLCSPLLTSFSFSCLKMFFVCHHYLFSPPPFLHSHLFFPFVFFLLPFDKQK